MTLLDGGGTGGTGSGGGGTTEVTILVSNKDLFIKNRSKFSRVLLLCLLRFFMNKSLIEMICFIMNGL